VFDVVEGLDALLHITLLWPFVRDYLGEPVPEESFTHLHLS